MVYLRGDGYKANIQVRTMMAMINQKDSNQSEKMTQFYKLHGSIEQKPPKPVKKFQNDE